MEPPDDGPVTCQYCAAVFEKRSAYQWHFQRDHSEHLSHYAYTPDQEQREKEAWRTHVQGVFRATYDSPGARARAVVQCCRAYVTGDWVAPTDDDELVALFRAGAAGLGLEAVRSLIDLMYSAEGLDRNAAAFCLGYSRPSTETACRVVDALLAGIVDQSPVVFALAGMAPASIPQLGRLLGHPDQRIRDASIRALCQMGEWGQDAVPFILASLRSRSANLDMLVSALGDHGTAAVAAVPALMALLREFEDDLNDALFCYQLRHALDAIEPGWESLRSSTWETMYACAHARLMDRLEGRFGSPEGMRSMLQSFWAFHLEGSLSGAARSLGVDRDTVTRNIRELGTDHCLGVVLTVSQLAHGPRLTRLSTAGEALRDWLLLHPHVIS